MGIFCAVDDLALIALIAGAQKRIVFIAPGVHAPVAKALGKRFLDLDGGLEVTVVLDPDEEVCRTGYGDIEGLELVHQQAQRNGFCVRSQTGLRVGVLLADDQTLVWSPTPRSIEAPPASTGKQQTPAAPGQLELMAFVAAPSAAAPNGLLLGFNPGEQLARAVAAEGLNVDPHSAEIGKAPVTLAQLNATKQAIERNPIIPVDLARVTHVFNSKLQFVELKIKGARISATQLKLPSRLLNVDAKGDLQDLIEGKLKALAEFKTVEVPVPAYHNGNALAGQVEQVSEASLERTRSALEKKYIYDIKGYGRLVARDDKQALDAQVDALKVQLLAHAKELKKLVEQQSSTIIDSAVELIMERAERSGSSFKPGRTELRDSLLKGLQRGKAEEPQVSLVFKDVTFEQTRSEDFRNRVNVAVPAHKRKQLGAWTEEFAAVRETNPDDVAQSGGLPTVPM